MVLLSVILMLVVGAILMGLFWKLNWLKIVKITTAHKIRDHVTDGGMLHKLKYLPPPSHEPDKAVLKIDKILDFEIPKWMAVPPFSYAICFLIICCGLAIILFPLQYLLVKL